MIHQTEDLNSSSDSPDFYTTKNIASWNEAALRHAAINATLHDQVRNPTFNNLHPDFEALIDTYSVNNKSVVQVCCNNGIDLLSIKNKGAGRCVGIDGAQAFIDQAISLAQAASRPDIEFCHSDIYQLPSEYQNSFDVAIVTVGVLNWMPDLLQFMKVCASLLVPNGVLLMEELHPILGMYEEGQPSFMAHSYFNVKPVKNSDGLDYFTHEKYAGREHYSFHHSLADILMSAAACHLQLLHIKELPYNVGNFCADLELSPNNPPLAINLGWRKCA